MEDLNLDTWIKQHREREDEIQRETQENTEKQAREIRDVFMRNHYSVSSLPFIGWIIEAVVAVSMAVPFWFFWTLFDFGSIYFYWIPETYQSIPFWHCVGLFIVISILKSVLIPTLVNVSNKQKVGGE